MPRANYVLVAAVFGGIFPDFDLFFFYFVDDRAIHHHRYWVHAPAFGVFVGFPLALFTFKNYRRLLTPLLAFLAAVQVHIALDSIAGGVMWLWPFSGELVTLISVPAKFGNWILNFILHPVFLLEIAIWILATVLFLRARNAS